MSADASSTRQTATTIKERLAECFQRGSQLMTVDKNYDYAHTMFAECAVHEPANLNYAETLLRNLQLKFAGHKKKASLFSRGGSRELKKALDQKQWKSVFRLGIEILKDNPWDVTTLRTLAQACAALHYNEVELAYLKQALEANPKDIETNKHCARSLARMGQFDQAIACWHRIETIRPGDKEAARMIGELSEEKLKYAGGRPATSPSASETSTSDEAEEKSSAATMEVTLSERQLLERAIADDPYDVTNYLELADLLCSDKLFGEAEGVLNRGIATIGEHTAVMERLQRVRTQRVERELAIAEARRKAEERLKRKPIRIPWLELILAIAAVALLFQFFPAVAATAWRIIDVRNWSRPTWFLVNLAGVVLLCVYRYAPHLLPFRRKNEITE